MLPCRLTKIYGRWRRPVSEKNTDDLPGVHHLTCLGNHEFQIDVGDVLIRDILDIERKLTLVR